MSLKDGIVINSYEDLIEYDSFMLVHSTSGLSYSYNNIWNSPSLVEIRSGGRYFGTDIKKFIVFPLYRVELVAYTKKDEEKENDNTTECDGN